MTTHTVTPAQAQRLAHQFAAMKDAESLFIATLSTLTLGTPVDGMVLSNINTDDGTLTFHVAHPVLPHAE